MVCEGRATDEFAQVLDIAVPLAAVIVPAFVLGFGAVWLAMHNGFGQIRSELGDVRKELDSLSERVARIEGRLDPYGAGGLADPG